MNPIAELRRIHPMYWRDEQNVSSATRAAGRITREWQQTVVAGDAAFVAEYRVHGLGEKIDLVDVKRRVAYELKVSPNNTHMEFYRDVFKVLAHNEAAPPRERIKELVFLAPTRGAERPQRGLGETACRIAEKFGFTVKVIAI